ncbi:MAG: peptide chain release factor-like protein [Chlamydiia bacterium]|nr:peptide chain release factor-like protein [Chlamydiia bacterium]
MPISPEKQLQLEKRMRALGIEEEDLEEKFILGSGKGGQKVNKTSNCVWLKHIPSKLEVKCMQERSRELNRYRARQLLCEKFEEKILQVKTKKQQEIEKIRRQKRRRSKRAQEKVLEQKSARSDLKKLRQPPET